MSAVKVIKQEPHLVFVYTQTHTITQEESKRGAFSFGEGDEVTVELEERAP